jgi:DNA-binding MarR family transcriptional regulator
MSHFVSPRLPDRTRRDIASGLERLIVLLRLLTVSGELSLTTVSTLARLARGGPHRLSDLAAREGVTQPAMTQLVSRLERDGLAERRGDPGDRRLVIVHLTPAGERMLERRRRRWEAELSRLLDALSPADQAALAAALPAISRLVELGSD